jgi:Leucine-rich repeat (LRR) protein
MGKPGAVRYICNVWYETIGYLSLEKPLLFYLSVNQRRFVTSALLLYQFFYVFCRRGLTKLPLLVGETRIRLLSLQHNLITRLDGVPTQGLTKLVFLDIYDNQLERITGLDSLENLRVLLVGKNR